MLKKTGVAVALLGMLALSSLLMSCGSGHDRRAGILYVVSQSLSNISSFAVDLFNGDLSLITENLASTCPPSTTCGLPLTISVDPTGATAFVLTQLGVTGFNVNSDGSLSTPIATVPTDAAPFPANHTALAMTSTAAGDMLFLISVGQPNPTDCDPAVGPLGSDCPMISVYSTQPGSTTATLTGNNCAANAGGPCSYPLSRVPTAISAVNFTFPGQPTHTVLFVTSNHDLTTAHNDSTLSVFSVDSSGNLAEQSASPYSAQAPNPLSVLAVNTNPPQQNTGGVFVYVGSQAAVTGSVSTFEVCTQVDTNCNQGDVDNENLAVTGKPLTVGQNPIAMLADPTHTFLYIACYVGNNVYAFKMTTGTGILTPLSPALEPTGAGPVSLAINPSNNNSNEYLYVSNNTGSTLSGYTVNLTTGGLSNPLAPFIFTPGNPYGLAGR